jgi:hypothetical protein
MSDLQANIDRLRDSIDAYERATRMPPISLRAYFAAHALASAVEDYDRLTRAGHGVKEPALPFATKVMSREQIIAGQAVRYADALIAALNKGGAS